MISFSNKFVYIHVPKCGGTSVLNKIGYLTTFNKSGWGKQDHSFMSETKTHLSNQNFEEYYKFTIVRNTWKVKPLLRNSLCESKSCVLPRRWK